MPVKMHVKKDAFTMSVGAARVLYIGGEPYTGDCTVTPKADTDIVLNTCGKLLDDDVIVKKIPYFEVSNTQDGKTVYIGSEV